MDMLLRCGRDYTQRGYFYRQHKAFFARLPEFSTASQQLLNSSARVPLINFFPFNGLNPRHIILIRKS